jgi:VIT1/CCC1 family predicted Fe2+/Mn2+ transporter
VNDGLVSNASLIFGVAGANPDAAMVLLKRGPCRRVRDGGGEFVSVRSRRELFSTDRLERDGLAESGCRGAGAALIYKAKGLSGSEGERVAKQPSPIRTCWIHLPARNWGSIRRAGLAWARRSRRSLFAVGAAIPLLPFVFGAGASAADHCLADCRGPVRDRGDAVAFTGRGALVSGVRMLLLGALAGSVTFAVGKLFGVSVS